MSIQKSLEKLFSGWRASITSVPTGYRITVPRMSDGAMKVLRGEIDSELPEVYEVVVKSLSDGGYQFDLSVEADTAGAIIRVVQAAESLGIADLARTATRLKTEMDPVEQAALLTDLSLELEPRKEFDLARRALVLAEWLAPKNVKIRFNHATLLLKLGEIVAAIKRYEVILTIDPTFEPALHNLTAYFAKRGDLRRAREYLTRLLTGHPRSSTAHVLAGQIAQEEGQLGQALAEFLRGIQLDQLSAEAHYRTARALRELELIPEALTHWSRYQELVGEVPEGRYLPVRLMIDGTPPGAGLMLDGQPIGQAPKALMDLVPGSHYLAARQGPNELTMNFSLENGQNYLLRYNLPSSRMSIELTTIQMTLKDEAGQEISGPELGRSILERMEKELSRTLSGEDVLGVVLYECLKDGRTSDQEKDLIFSVLQFLKIPAAVHQRIFQQVQERIRTEGAQTEAAEPEVIYRLLVTRALEDGTIISEENNLLDEIGRILSITRPRRREIEQEEKNRLTQRSN